MSEPMLPVIRHLEGTLYEIESASGATYIMQDDPPRCSCSDWQYRRIGTPERLCKHLRLLAQVLAAQRACPACRGKRFLFPAFAHAEANGRPSTDPLPCAICDGMGTRADCDPPLSLPLAEEAGRAAKGAAAEREDALLRELFR